MTCIHISWYDPFRPSEALSVEINLISTVISWEYYSFSMSLMAFNRPYNLRWTVFLYFSILSVHCPTFMTRIWGWIFGWLCFIIITKAVALFLFSKFFYSRNTEYSSLIPSYSISSLDYNFVTTAVIVSPFHRFQ